MSGERCDDDRLEKIEEEEYLSEISSIMG